MDENDVNIPRYQKTLEQIRKEREHGGSTEQDGLRGYNRHREEGASGDTGRVAQGAGSDGREDQGTRPPDRYTQEHGQRIRPADGQDLNARQGAGDTGPKTNRKRNNPPPIDVPQAEKAPPFSFNLRNALPHKKEQSPVKLFTKEEAEREYDKIYDVYIRGSGILDDILEIIVKDHEPVQIWQLDDSEAEILARMHLDRAQHDEQAARSARKLIEIYERLYIYVLLYPRMKQTGSHVKEHGGFSFR